jgi:hypothetical protein
LVLGEKKSERMLQRRKQRLRQRLQQMKSKAWLTRDLSGKRMKSHGARVKSHGRVSGKRQG